MADEEESSAALSELFHGFLAIGTLGTDPLLDDPSTPTFSISMENIAEKDTEVTENELKQEHHLYSALTFNLPAGSSFSSHPFLTLSLLDSTSLRRITTGPLIFSNLLIVVGYEEVEEEVWAERRRGKRTDLVERCR